MPVQNVHYNDDVICLPYNAYYLNVFPFRERPSMQYIFLIRRAPLGAVPLIIL